MSVLFGAIAALSIGLSDLFNRRVAIQASVPTVAFTLQAFALVTALTSLLFVESAFAWRDVLIGCASGVAMAVALAAYYVGVTRSTATVVAPVVGALSSIIPFGYTIATGASAGSLAVVGAGLAFLGLILISLRGLSARGGAVQTEREEPHVENVGTGLLFGTICGTGYAVALILVLNASDAAGTWPAVGERLVAALVTLAFARYRNVSVLPPAGLRLTAVIGGLLAGGGTVFFIVAKTFDPAKAVIVTSTYPAVIVLVGYLAFADRVTTRQLIGLACVLVGVAAVAGG
jgi:drug/metabolite transporter (DMT)-like permease